MPFQEAHPHALRQLAVLGKRVDDDVAGTGGPEVARHLTTDPAEAADDEVVGRRVDQFVHPALGEHVREVARDEELGDGDERVEERTDAHHDQEAAHDLPARRVGVGERPLRGQDVQRPLEAVPRVLALGECEADHPESEQPGDDARQRADPPLEQRDLAVVFAAARLHQ